MSDLTNLPLMGAETRVIQTPTQIKEEGGFFRNVADGIANSWWYQQGSNLLDANIPADPDFNPLSPELIKGKEEYIRYLQEARSRNHFDAIYDRIKAYEQRRSRLAEEGGLGSELTAGLIDPTNFIGLGVGRGVGIARGLLTGAATTSAVSVGTSLLERNVAPMETSEIYTRAAFAAGIGGMFGGIVGRSIPSNPMVGDLSNTLTDFGKAMDQGIESGSFGPSNLADRNAPREPFVARETGSNQVGFAPAMGVEKLVSENIGDLGPMVASGHRSFEDLALTMAGTGQLMKRNVAGEASPRSAYALSGYWTGLAGRTMKSVDDVYTRYISGGTDPASMLGANIPAAAMRVGQFFGVRPGEGKMTINEFYSAVSRAHFRDKIDSPIPEVKEAALEVRKFFDEMRDYAVKSNMIMTRETAQRSLDRTMRSMEQKKKRIKEIEKNAELPLEEGEEVAKLDMAKLSPSELVQYSLLQGGINKLERRADYYRGSLRFMESKQRPGPKTEGVAAIGEKEPVVVGAPANANVPSINGLDVTYGPTNKVGADGNPVIALFRPEENRIIFDREASDAAFARQAWRNPRVEGVNPLPDELFPTADAWADFIMRHEVAHVTVRRSAELDKAGYENLINEIAMRQINELRQPTKVTTGAAAVDEMAVAAANENYSKFLGPANEQYYLPRIYLLDKIMADELGEKKFRAIIRQWYMDNPLKPDELRLEKSIQTMRDINLSFGKYKASIYDIIKDIESNIERTQSYVNYMEKKLEQKGLTEQEQLTLDYFKKRGIPTTRQQDALERLRERYEEASPTPRQKQYLEILEKRITTEELKKASVARAELRAQGIMPEGIDVDFEMKSIEARVDETMAHILKEAELGELSLGRKVDQPFISRRLDIPNELIWDFIEDDINSLMKSYAHRVGRSLEYARAFGERDAEDAIMDAAIQAAREMNGTQKEITDRVNKLISHAENLRDFTLGDVYSKNPLSINRKIVSAGANYSTVTSLGRALYSSFTEPAKAIMMHGFGRTFGFAFDALTDRKAFGQMADDMRQLTGQALDTAMGLSMSRYGEQGGPINGSVDWAGRMLDKATRPLAKFTNGPYFVLNLLGPYTDALKNFSNVMNSHFILEDAKMMAEGKASARTVKNMAALGFDQEKATRLASMPFERDRALNLANIQSWTDDDLVRDFGSAVASQTMRQVVTATEGDIPNIARGFIGAGDKRREIPYLRLPFQFMNFSFASTNKTLVSALQGREANVVGGLMSMMGLAYMSLYLKTPDKIWDKMPLEDRLVRTMEQSGFLGIFSDVSQKVEGLSQNRFGVRAAMGLPPRFGPRSVDDLSPIGEALGPTVSKGIDVYQLMFDDSMTSKEEARGIRRLIPLNDLFYLRGIINGLERSALDATN